MKDLAIVLVSGGMDSCVTAAIANEHYRLALLHVNYSQRTESRELKAFWDIAAFYNIPEERILISDIDYLGKIGGSSLTDLSMTVQDAQLNSKEIPTSYVPLLALWNRTALVIPIAGQYIMKPLTNLSRQARNPRRASRWKPRSLAKANQRL